MKKRLLLLMTVLCLLLTQAPMLSAQTIAVNSGETIIRLSDSGVTLTYSHD